MQKPTFVHVTYIHTTPERLWQGLTDPADTQRYWGVTFKSDWSAGSTLIFEQEGVRIADPAQVILEAEPFRRLSHTWHPFTQEWADINGLSGELLAQMSREPRTKVTFDITPIRRLVKLTVVHDDFDPDSVVPPMISEGWPQVLSGLKTLLETGESLPV